MDLFRGPGDYLVEELQKIDLARITPLDAMNFLSKLQEKTRLFN
jgi:hypothetical protein